MGTLYKKDEGLKKLGNNSNTAKKVWQRKPSQNRTLQIKEEGNTNTSSYLLNSEQFHIDTNPNLLNSEVFTKFTPSDITKHHQNTSEEKGHVKEYSEIGMSTKTSTSEAISSLKWIDKRDQTSTARTTAINIIQSSLEQTTQHPALSEQPPHQYQSQGQ